MDIDKDLIGKPPNQAIVINDKLINHNSGTVEAETSQVPEHDTREQLEADARALQTRIWQAGANSDGISLSHIFELLDRQAAITERETRLRELYRFEENHRANIDATEEVNRKLNERIAELTAERDSLRSRLKTQANSFQKLERDNAKLRDTLARVRGLVGDA